MKQRILIPLLIGLGMLTAACHRPSAVETAALEMYNRYASKSDQLTVAYLGDYCADGQVYNGVLLQAHTDEMWQWLCSEFGIIEYSDVTQAALEQVIPHLDSMPNVHATSLILSPQMSIGLDTQQLQQLALDAARGIIEQMTDQTLDSLPMQVMVLDGNLLPTDSSSMQQMIQAQQEIYSLTQQHNDNGYVMSIDHDEHIVWLFFYSSPFEREQLMRMVTLPANMGIAH